MNQAPYSPDDPRLTAYALGELPEAERAEVEAAVQADPALQTAVAEIRDLASDLTVALEGEPVALPTAVEPSTGRELRRVTRFPYLLVSGLAAAGFAVVVALLGPGSPGEPQHGQASGPERRVYELNLATLPPATEPVAEVPGDSATMDRSVASDLATLPEGATASASARAARVRPVPAGPVYGFVPAESQPRSFVPLHVDATAFAEVRRFLRNRELPPAGSVHVAGLINAFPYRYPAPADRDPAPVAAGIEAASAPWNPAHRLVRIGLKGREVAPDTRPPANLVFLIDVSGSMHGPARLPVVLDSLRQLIDRLRPDDRIALVTYAGQGGLVLPSTPASSKREIHAALASLRPADPAAGAKGVRLAYDIAGAHFVPGGLNRVLLCTDGEFNLGVADRGELVRLIGERAQAGIAFDVLGFDAPAPGEEAFARLAQAGGGFHGHAATAAEARRLLVGRVESAFAAVARDVEVEVEFNPARVESYRLIGYEDGAQAGGATAGDRPGPADFGADHAVTALYEIVPRGSGAGTPAAPPEFGRPLLPPLPLPRVEPSVLQELLTVRVRYRQPDLAEGAALEVPFVDGGAVFADASGDFKFAAAVAGFGLILRDSPHKGQATFEQVLSWAEGGLDDDAEGHRAEFVDLVKRARALSGG